MAKHPVTKVAGRADVFSYRGVKFRRDDSCRGKWGHYKTIIGYAQANGLTCELRGHKRAELLAEIDAMLAHREGKASA